MGPGAAVTYYRMAESLAVRWADALVADARGIAEYYDDEFGVPTELITYGAPIQVDAPADLLGSVAVESRRYHLVVARFEPENHVLEIVEGYRRSAASQPLVVVGSAPYADEYTSRIEEAAAGDPRIRLLGGVWDQRLLDQLYAHALTYLHGHSVGGTNPSLLRAMGAGTAVMAYDVVFNREVLGDDGRFFAGPGDIAAALLSAEAAPDDAVATGRAAEAQGDPALRLGRRRRRLREARRGAAGRPLHAWRVLRPARLEPAGALAGRADGPARDEREDWALEWCANKRLHLPTAGGSRTPGWETAGRPGRGRAVGPRSPPRWCWPRSASRRPCW